MIELMCKFAPLSYVALPLAIALAGALVGALIVEVMLRLTIGDARSAGGSTSS